MWARRAFSVAAKFFERLDHAPMLRRMMRPRADVGEADLPQQFADRSRVIVDAEALADDLLQIDAPPAHHAIDGAVGAGLDDGRQGGELIDREPGRVPLRADVLQLVGAVSLKRWTQSRRVWRSIPPIRAACSRSMPSRTAANERRQRLWLACLVPAASRRRSKAE